MHYYQFNIGDYTSHTARLSLYEDLAYRRLLDLYYLNERPFNECSRSVAREIGMLDQIDSVEFVLVKYFELIDGFWTQLRVDDEISIYHSKLKSASKAGKASAKARKLKASKQEFNDRSTTVQPTINHKPLTINQEPLNNIKINTPYQLIVDAYHNKLNDLSRVVIISDKRKTAIKKLFNYHEDHKDIDWWNNYFSIIKRSDFLMGRVQSNQNHTWTCDFDFIINMNNFIKIIEGKYK